MKLKRKFPVCPFGFCVNKTYLEYNINQQRTVGNEFIPLACSDGWGTYCYSGGLKKKTVRGEWVYFLVISCSTNIRKLCGAFEGFIRKHVNKISYQNAIL